MKVRMKDVVKIAVFIMVMTAMMITLPTKTAHAGEMLSEQYGTDTDVDIDGSRKIPYGQYGALEVANTDEILKKHNGSSLKYQWYMSNSSIVKEHGWYKIDETYNWLFDGNTKKLRIYIAPDFAEDDAHYLVCCLMTTDKGKKIRSKSIEIIPNALEVKQISVKPKSGSLNPAYGDSLEFDFEKEDPAVQYEIGHAVRVGDNYVAQPGDGVQWFKWDETKNEWAPKRKGTFFEEGSYKLKITLAGTNGYIFSPGLVNGTKAYLNGESVEKEFTSNVYAEMSITKVFIVKKGSNPYVVKLKRDVDFYKSYSLKTPNYTIPAGKTVRIEEIYKEWVKLTDPDGNVGYVKNSQLFDEMEHHWYACTVNALNVRKTPDKAGQRVSSLKYGDIVYAEQAHEGWVKIKREADGQFIGWVMGQYLAMSPEKKYAIPPQKGTVNVNALTVRADAGTSCERIGGFTKDTKYEIMVTGRKVDADGNGWLIFNYNGQLGYAMEKYLSGVKFETVEMTTMMLSLPVDLPTGISKVSLIKPSVPMPTSMVSVGDAKISSGSKDTVYFTASPADGYSFPVDTSKIKVDLGTKPEFKLVKIEKQSNGDIKVYLKELNYCKKNGHVPAASFTVDRASTCSVAGSKSKHCTICKATTNVTAIAKKAHTYDTGVVTKKPTCTAKGVKKFTCKVCKSTKNASINALGHKYSTAFTVDKKPVVDRAGSKSKHCTRCSAKTSVTSIPRVSTYTIRKGKKATLPTSVKASKWKTSKKKIVKVTSAGVITGKKKGTAKITAIVNGKSYTCKVKVIK